MPYSKVSDAPANIRKLDGVALTLAQVNWIANVADGIDPDKVKNPWAVAIAQFKRSFRKEGGKWVKRKEESAKEASMGGRVGVLGRLLDMLSGNGSDSFEAGSKDQNFKTEGGVRFKRSDYAVRGEADKPTTWKLRLAEGSSGSFTVAQVARGITAMQPGGFRGRKVQLEAGERAEAMRNIGAAIGKVGDDDQKKTLRARLAKVKAKELLKVAIEGKDLSLEAIRRGIQGMVTPPPTQPVAYDKEIWVRDVFPDGNTGYAILEQGKHLYKAPYTIQEDDTVKLGGVTRVTVAYQEAPQATKEFGFGIKVIEGKDGETFWLTRTSNAFEDKEEETFRTKALEDYVAQVDEGIPAAVKEFLEERGLPATDHGELWFWHIPGSRIGEPKWKGVEGRFLIEVGVFDDTPQGKAAAAHFKEHGDEYRTSHGYLYHPDDKAQGDYAWLWKFETSPLPEGAESNPWTGIDIITKEVKMIDEKKKAALVEIFGQEVADGILAKAQEDSKTLEDLGITFKEKESKGGGEGAEGKTPEIVIGQTPETLILEKDSKAMELIAEAVAEKLQASEVFTGTKSALDDLAKRIGAIEEADKPFMRLGQSFRASQSEETVVDTKGIPKGAMPPSQHPLDKQYAKQKGGRA